MHALTIYLIGRCGRDIAASKSRREMQLAATYNIFCLLYLSITSSHFPSPSSHFQSFRVTFNRFESLSIISSQPLQL
jgi:hypothetical protein